MANWKQIGSKRKRTDSDDEGREQPKKSYTKKSYIKKKSYKKKNRESYSLINRGPNIMPDTYSTKMVYCFRGTLNSTSGAIAKRIFRGNSLYDPDLTGTGTQPMGFDQLMTLYEHYRVMGSEIVVRCTNGAVGEMSDIVVVPTNTTTLPGTGNEVNGERPYAVRRYGAVNQDGTRNAIVNYMSTSKIAGVPKEKVRTEDDYSGSSVTDPALQWYWQILYQPADQVSSTSIYYTVKITFYATYYDRRELNQSDVPA